jgi:MFS family permease
MNGPDYVVCSSLFSVCLPNSARSTEEEQLSILQSRIGGEAVTSEAAPIPPEKGYASAIYALTSVLLTLLTSTMFQAISTVVLPRAIADLNGFARYPWPSTTFALTSAIAMLVFAKLSDLYGRKRIYLVNTGIFVGSLFVGAAAGTLPIPIDGMNQLVAAYGLLGIYIGAIISLSYILIGDLFPPTQRARYLALVVADWAFAFVMGPGIGGWITDHYSWRWAFVAAAPIGIIAITTVFFKLPKMRPPLIQRKIDWPGIATLCGWVVPLLLALTLIGQAGRSEWNVNALMIISATFGVVFLFVEVRAAEPLVVLSLFRDRRISLASLNLLLTGFSTYCVAVYLPLFMQGAAGLSATESAAIFTPYLLSIMAGNLACGYFPFRARKYRLWGITGSGLASIGLFLLSRMSGSTNEPEIFLKVIVCGFALGLLTVTYDVMVQNAAPRKHLGVATGLTQFVTALGGTIGLATSGAILLRTYHMHVDTLIPPGLPKDLAFAFGDPLRLVSQRANLETSFSQVTNGSSLLSRLIEGSRAGLVSGVHFIFLLSAGLMVTSMVVNLFLIEAPPRKDF